MLVHSRSLPCNLQGFPNNLPAPIYTPRWSVLLWEFSVFPKNITKCPWPVLKPEPLDLGMTASWSLAGLKFAGNSFVSLSHGQVYYKNKVSCPSTKHNDPNQGSNLNPLDREDQHTSRQLWQEETKVFLQTLKTWFVILILLYCYISFAIQKGF